MDKNQEDVNLKLSEISKNSGSFLKMKRLLKKGADPNIISDEEEGMTVFLEAAQQGNLKAVKIMMKYGADLDIVDEKFGMNAILFACSSGHKKTIEFLIESGSDVLSLAKDKSTGLMHAAYRHYYDIFGFLCEKGIDINAKNDKGQNAFMYAADKCQGGFYESNLSALHKLKILIFQELINYGCDINSVDNNGNTVLAYVLSKGCVPLTRFLLENGADPNIIKKNLYLMAESAEDNSEILIELLKKHGAEVKPFINQYKISVYCEECRNVMPLNGPLNKIKCPDCLTYTPLDKKIWKNILKYSVHADFKYSIEDTCNVEIERSDPACSECGEKLNINIKTKEALICPKCNTGNQHFPAEAWFSEYNIYEYRAKHIFCAEAESQTAEELNKKTKPIAFKCVSCAANLSADAKAPRNYICDHCGTKQYLPDPLWKSLHPVKKRKHWYVLFESENKL